MAVKSSGGGRSGRAGGGGAVAYSGNVTFGKAATYSGQKRIPVNSGRDYIDFEIRSSRVGSGYYVYQKSTGSALSRDMPLRDLKSRVTDLLSRATVSNGGIFAPTGEKIGSVNP